MRTNIDIGFFDFLTFLGVFQGLLLSWFFIKNSNKKSKANLFQGLLIFALSLTIFEELLNNTGYIVKVLPISNYSEFLNFTFGPLFFLYIRQSLNPAEKGKYYWVHFILAGVWLCYMIFHFMQPNELKYNSYLSSKHPDWQFLNVDYELHNDDPLGIRHYNAEMLILQFSAYLILSVVSLVGYLRSSGQTFFRIHEEKLITLRNSTFYFIIILFIFVSVKAYFGNDVGDYFIATWISIMFFSTSYQILDKSEFFSQPHSFMELPKLKYSKSSLSEEDKIKLLAKIKTEMELNFYFTNNMASLPDLSKRLHEGQHNVSQVINEKMKMNFFELLAWYRIEEAKKILIQDTNTKITIEELAEKVGYNSKSSFNNAFKRLTLQTPTEFRKSNGII